MSNMKVKVQNKQNFGWAPSTHKIITKRVLQQVHLGTYGKRIIRFSVRPDFDERGGIANNPYHFFPSDRIDIKSGRNAFERFKYHVEKMLYAIDAKQMDISSEHAGRALHFLQDMTQPQHTQRVSFLDKVITLKPHVAFENCANGHLDNFFQWHTPQQMKDKPFNDLALENIRQSSAAKFPLGANKDDWIKIGARGIHQTIDSSRAFLIKVKELFNGKLPIEELQELNPNIATLA